MERESDAKPYSAVSVCNEFRLIAVADADVEEEEGPCANAAAPSSKPLHQALTGEGKHAECRLNDEGAANPSHKEENAGYAIVDRRRTQNCGGC